MSRYYFIEGEIGAGKTTFIKILEEYLQKTYKVAVCYEPVKLWQDIGILQKFYDNPARYSYTFQSFVYCTRIMKIKEMMETNPNCDIYLIERSPISDKIFMSIQQNDTCELNMYKIWCDTYDSLLPFPLKLANVIYLKPTIENCQLRLKARNRTEESAVSSEYQQKLREAHEYYFENIKHNHNFELLNEPFAFKKAIVIDDLTNHDYRENEAILAQIVEKIL